ncbi:hypothetical protein HMPREF0297_0194, partial [Corynebacterium jeikeium ATCC 43734]
LPRELHHSATAHPPTAQTASHSTPQRKLLATAHPTAPHSANRYPRHPQQGRMKNHTNLALDTTLHWV